MEHVRVEVNDGIAEVVMDRPKVNALDTQLLKELAQGMAEAAEDDAVRGALLRGEGRAFSAGLDLKEVARRASGGIEEFLQCLDETLNACFCFPKPLAVPLSGHAIAGGMVIALTADYVALGRGEQKLGLSELAVGVPFPRTAFEIVRLGLPPRGLRRFVYEADSFGPQEAFELGFGDVLVDDPHEATRAWLDKVTGRSIDTFTFVKAQIRKEAWERIARQTHAERRSLVETLRGAVGG
jgi:enoyl-CoA hydratase